MLRLKKAVNLLLVLCLMAAMLPTGALAVGVDGTGHMPSYLNIKDESSSYSVYSNYWGLMYDLEDEAASPAAEVFQYSVPTDGVTVLFFFRGTGTCDNSNRLVEEITRTQWAQDSRVNIVAVESSRASRDTVQAFLAAHDTNHVIDKVYYNPDSNTVALWYSKLVSVDGNMADVMGLGGSLAFAYILLITGENDGNYIRFSLPGVNTAAYITTYMREFIETSDEAAVDSLADIIVPGKLRYDHARTVFDLVNTNRSTAKTPALTLSGELTELAMQRAAECAVYYGHTRPNREGALSVSSGPDAYSGSLLAENIAAGQRDPFAVMSSWMSSKEGHREAILNPNYSQIGIGCFENNGTLYWVQLFGVGNDNSPAPRDSVGKDMKVQTYISRLDLELSSLESLSIPGTGAVNAPEIYTLNTGAELNRKTLLLPQVDSVTGADGTQIAWAASVPGSGVLTLSGTGNGACALDIAAYKGQVGAPRVQVDVSGIAPNTTAKIPDGIFNNCRYVFAASYEGGKMTSVISGNAKGRVAVFDRPLESKSILYFLSERCTPLCGPLQVP